MARFRSARHLPVLLIACGVLLLPAQGARAQSNAPAEEFTAFAVHMGTIRSGETGQLVIQINRWNSEAEQEALMSALREKGQQGMISAFRKSRPVGTIRSLHSVGYDLQLAYQEPGPDGGRRIIIATDRPVGFGEATNRPQSMDYPFSVIELFIPREGPGEGTLSLAARLVPAGKKTIAENYDTQPVQLKNVRAELRK
ncbi:hypothetical protein BH24ACI4_BH24ACI4_21900 [soil metagenome]